MEYNLEKFLYIKDNELFVLLASLGVEKIYGISSNIDSDENSQINENDVIASLYNKGYISLIENKTVISQELSEILANFIQSTSFIYVRNPESEIPVFTIYFSDKGAVFLERSLNEDDTFKLSNISIDALKSFLRAECLKDDIAPIEEDFVNTDEGVSFWDDITEDMIFENNFTSVVEKFDFHNGKMINRLVVQDVGLSYRLHFQSNDTNLCLENTSQNQEYVLLQLLNK